MGLEVTATTPNGLGLALNAFLAAGAVPYATYDETIEVFRCPIPASAIERMVPLLPHERAVPRTKAAHAVARPANVTPSYDGGVRGADALRRSSRAYETSPMRAVTAPCVSSLN